ncbi:aromatase/cyclase [Micromonospora sp. BRA006-A]|uniref:aromatase/cyclase n=1 Tax=Micromonospora sp. BRA006-A TaxID=2962860 RepID=UPI00296F4DBD|nr:aromatase/cyclase [Micromonospora sp. BRA006-A]MDW3848640.1 aromatase/cyclase [Micromonospora sp. BRA006-A]
MAHHMEHRITVAAPPHAVFDLVADVRRWPHVFPPTVHAEQVERLADGERIRIWATANGQPKTWLSRRRVDREGLRIAFRQEVSQAPVAAMGGEWILTPAGGGSTEVRLLHDFDAVGDDPDAVDWIRRAVDGNSDAELAALRAAAERDDAEDLYSFDDTVTVRGDQADVYGFLNEADRWPQRLPHVARVDLREETPGLQLLDMDTRTADGHTHRTTSVRVCVPDELIVYKQLRTPPLLSLHTGRWSLREAGGALMVTSTHTVVIRPEAVPELLGADATMAQARQRVRQALGGNSRATLQRAKEYAEARFARAR